MKQINQLLFISFFLTSFCMLSCGNDGVQQVKNLWPDTQKIQLQDENVYLQIPKQLTRSSRYRLQQDMPNLEKDSLSLVLFQDALAGMEFDDAEIDVFVDSTSNWMIIIMNLPYVPLDKNIGAMFNGILKKKARAIEAKYPNLKVNKIASRMKQNKQQKMMKFKNQYLDEKAQRQFFESIYFISTKIQSYAIVEIAAGEKDIEKHLWSIKD
ncbi:MAG: hypothetical protein AB8G15_01965 [Saprospiraceae bacterium]